MARKPLSVWLGQIILGLPLIFFAGSFVYHAILAWPAPLTALASRPRDLAIFFAVEAGKLAVIGFAGWTVVLISRRSQYGRWFGMILLMLLFCALIYSWVNPPEGALLPSNDAERGGYFLAQVLMVVLFLVFLWRFGFSRGSRAFFARSQEAPESATAES